ncbi:MAG: DUF2189 domain-containing protein [Thiogranum sp.]|nr:DUF2189 domain-containing protein [Thiogranum sp.]
MTLLISKTGIEIEIPEINRVERDAPYRWLRKGWSDLKVNPLFSIGLGIVFVAAGYLASYAVWQAPWALLTAATGFVLVAPVMAIGFYAVSCAREQGLVPNLAQAMRCWSGNGRSVLLYGLMLFLVLFFWSRFNWLMTALMMDTAGGVFAPDLAMLVSSAQGWGFIAVYAGVGLLFAIAVFAGSVVTLPLMMDRKIDPVTAAVTSLNTVRRNKRTMAQWAVIIFGLTGVGIATGYLGLALIFPLLGHASWHAYRELVREKEKGEKGDGGIIV